MANILLPTQQLRLQEGYAKDTNVGVTNASIASRFATIQPVRSNTHIPFMINPADQMNYAKRAVGIVEQYQETQRAREKEVVFNNAVNDYTQKLNDITNAFKDERGKNAIDNYDKYKAKIDNLNKEYGDVFTKHADLQQQFTVATSKLNSRATLELDNWKSNETIKAKNESLKNSVENAFNTFVYNAGSPAEKKYLQEAQNAFNVYSEYNGQDEDTAKAEFSKFFTENAYVVADHYCNIKSFGQALSFIERYKSMLDPKAYFNIRDRIKQAQDVERASKAGRTSVGDLTTEDIMLLGQKNKRLAYKRYAEANSITVDEVLKNKALCEQLDLEAQITTANQVGAFQQERNKNKDANSLIEDTLGKFIYSVYNKKHDEGKPIPTVQNGDNIAYIQNAINDISDKAQRESLSSMLDTYLNLNGNKSNDLLGISVLSRVFNWNSGIGKTLIGKSPEELALQFRSKEEFKRYSTANRINPTDELTIMSKLEKGLKNIASGITINSNPYAKTARTIFEQTITKETDPKKIKEKMAKPEYSILNPSINIAIDDMLRRLPKDSNGNVDPKLVLYFAKDTAEKLITSQSEVVKKLSSDIDDLISDLDLDDTDEDKLAAKDLFSGYVQDYAQSNNGAIPPKEYLLNKYKEQYLYYQQTNVKDVKHAVLGNYPYDTVRDNFNKVSEKDEIKQNKKNISERFLAIKENVLKDKANGSKQLNVIHFSQLSELNELLQELSFKNPSAYHEFIEEIKKNAKNSKMNQEYINTLIKDL